MPVGDPRFGRAVPCECQRAARAAKLLAASGLTQPMLAVTFVGLMRESTRRGTTWSDGMRAALARLTMFARDPMGPDGWVYLRGGPGTNKTRLLAATANALLARGYGVYYDTTPDFLDAMRASFDNGQSAEARAEKVESAETRIRMAIDADVLLLDDLGAEAETAWANEKLYRVLDGRYRAMRPTVVASNTPARLLEPRIASRLADTRLCDEYALGGVDQRRVRPTAPHTAAGSARVWARGEGEDMGLGANDDYTDEGDL